MIYKSYKLSTMSSIAAGENEYCNSLIVVMWPSALNDYCYLENSLNTVSYTHLDVYKRQSQHTWLSYMEY